MKVTLDTITFIALRFGQGMPLKEIGKRMGGKSQSTMRQLEAQIIREARNSTRLEKWAVVGQPHTKMKGNIIAFKKG